MPQDSIWPSQAVPDAVKQLIIKFFSIVDIKSDTSGELLADTIFSNTGQMKSGPKVFSGSAQIAVSRRGAWDACASRKHTILKVYTRNEAADDILLLGEVVATFVNGRAVTGQFCAQIIVDGVDKPNPKMKSYEVWADSTPFVDAMKETA